MGSKAPLGIPPAPPSLAQASWYWLKLGCTSFGGPAAQISMLHTELVERRRWIGEQRFLHALNYAMLLPGPEAQQLATYLGWLLHGVWGGVLAGALFVLPSLVVMCALAWSYMAFSSLPLVAAIFYGIKPAVTAVVLMAAYRVGRRSLRNGYLVAIAVLAFAALTLARLPFPLVVVGAALLGMLGGRVRPQAFTTTAAHPASAQAAPAVIDDATPLPPHARFRWGRLFAVVGVLVGLWAATLAGLAWRWGWSGTLTQMGWFFSQMAMVTFGGAYAVLPHVMQGAVAQYGWLTQGQMIDGLALGETTPGPLIMVVAFVGFLGGWHTAVLSDAPMLSGIAGACVATFFTFLPSFLFILVGGPLVERTRNVAAVTAPLVAITAAVVGVILNLAVVFAGHVFWPSGWPAPFDGRAALIAVVALVALARFKLGIIPVFILAGFAGVLGS